MGARVECPVVVPIEYTAEASWRDTVAVQTENIKKRLRHLNPTKAVMRSLSDLRCGSFSVSDNYYK
jgi:hypothetical protein